MTSGANRLNFWISVVYMIVPNVFCAQMKIVGEFNINDFVYIDIEPTYRSRMFYECMISQNSKKCILYLQQHSYRTFKVQDIRQITGLFEQNELYYKCAFRYDEYYNEHYYNYFIECSRQTIIVKYNCYWTNCLGNVFKIVWDYRGESYNDSGLNTCNTYLCSVYTAPSPTITIHNETTTRLTTDYTSITTRYIENTTTLSISSAFTTIKNYKTPNRGQNIQSTDHSPPTLLNNTFNSNPDSSLDTNLIIISVAVIVCVMICIVIMAHCLRKKFLTKNERNTTVIYANDSSRLDDNSVTICHNGTINRTDSSSKTLYAISKEKCSTPYDEYNVPCATEASNCIDIYSTIDPSKLSKNKTDKTRNKNILEQQKGVYQNINAEMDTSLTKPYARLGEHVKVVEHDYNCILPEQGDNLEYKEKLDSNTTQGNVTDSNVELTKPYARLGEHIKFVEHDYNCLLPDQVDCQAKAIDKRLNPQHLNSTDCTELSNNTAKYHHSVTGESSNPYSLAKKMYS